MQMNDAEALVLLDGLVIDMMSDDDMKYSCPAELTPIYYFRYVYHTLKDMQAAAPPFCLVQASEVATSARPPDDGMAATLRVTVLLVVLAMVAAMMLSASHAAEIEVTLCTSASIMCSSQVPPADDSMTLPLLYWCTVAAAAGWSPTCTCHARRYSAAGQAAVTGSAGTSRHDSDHNTCLPAFRARRTALEP